MAKNQDKEDMWGDTHNIVVNRQGSGFGFTLRHFIVYPADIDQGSVKGALLKDGSESKPLCEPMDTIFVKQVKEGGPAHSAGLRKGDRIVSVNGQNVTGKSYSQVIALIQASDQSLKLLVVPKDKDVLQMVYQRSAYASGQEPYRGTADDIPDPPQYAATKTREQPTTNSRYTSELKVVPEDGRRDKYAVEAHGGTGSFAPRQRTSLSSLGSGSTASSGHGGGIGSRDSLHRSTAPPSINLSESMPTGSKFGEQLLRSAEAAAAKTAVSSNLSHSYHGSIYPPHKQLGSSSGAKDSSNDAKFKNNTAAAGGGGGRSTTSGTTTAPSVQSRTSSRNILLKYPEVGGSAPTPTTTNTAAATHTAGTGTGGGGSRNRAGSLDSIRRGSDDGSSTSQRLNEGGSGQRLSIPAGGSNLQQAFDSVDIHHYHHPHLKQYISGAERSQSRDRGEFRKPAFTSSSLQGSKENIWSGGGGVTVNRGVGSGGDLRSSTDELRRRFFENGLGNQNNAADVNGSSRYKQPYTRANTTANDSTRPVLSQAEVTIDSYSSSPSQRIFSAVNLTSTPAQPYAQSSNRRIPPPEHMDFKPISGSTPDTNFSHHLSQLHSTPDSYGLTVSLSTVGSASIGALGTTTGSSEGFNSSMIGDHHHIDTSLYNAAVVRNSNNSPKQRLSLQEPPNNVNLVTERMKLFESEGNIEAVVRASPVNTSRSRSPRLELMQKAPQAFGSINVASKAAFYETKDLHVGKKGGNIGSGGHNSLTSSTSSLLQSLPAEDSSMSSIPFYFRTETPPVSLEKSPERKPHHKESVTSPELTTDPRTIQSRDRSPMGSFQDVANFDSLSPSPEPREFRRQKPTRRQPSYLTAIDNAKLTAPKKKKVPTATLR